jgi:exodeoxyribonuclease-3
MKTFLSWNVNGLRAVERKGLILPLFEKGYDAICLQETKLSVPEQIPESLRAPQGYHAYFDYSTEKKGYSGVAIYLKNQPKAGRTEFGAKYKTLGREGRLVEVELEDNLLLLNVYFPNGKRDAGRLAYKMEFYREFLAYIKEQEAAGKKIVFCGDVNTAHQEIDLARPKENSAVSGFLPSEREWLDKLVHAGFIDTFRLFEPAGGHYTWWDTFSRARERNVGWRIDYFFVGQNLKSKVKAAKILPAVMGSDHCPVTLTLDL